MSYEVIKKLDIKKDGVIALVTYPNNIKPIQPHNWTYKYNWNEVITVTEKQVDFFLMFFNNDVCFNWNDNSLINNALLNTRIQLEKDGYNPFSLIFEKDEVVEKYARMFIEKILKDSVIEQGYIKLGNTYVNGIRKTAKRDYTIKYSTNKEKIYTYNQFLLLRLYDYQVEFEGLN